MLITTHGQLWKSTAICWEKHTHLQTNTFPHYEMWRCATRIVNTSIKMSQKNDVRISRKTFGRFLNQHLLFCKLSVIHVSLSVHLPLSSAHLLFMKRIVYYICQMLCSGSTETSLSVNHATHVMQWKNRTWNFPIKRFKASPQMNFDQFATSTARKHLISCHLKKYD